MAASAPMPKTSDPKMTLIQTIVIRAFLASGWRKTLTPFEIASVPGQRRSTGCKGPHTTKRDAPSSNPVPGVPDGRQILGDL